MPRERGANRFLRALQRLAASNDELESADLRDVATKAGATPIGQCADRDFVRFRGTIAVVTVNPRGDNSWLEAEIKDGSGVVTLIWMGRHEIPGIDAGRQVWVEGRVSCADGRRSIYNPRYELLS